MQAPASSRCKKLKAAPAEAAGVEDPRVSAFLTRMAAFWEEMAQMEELCEQLIDRLMRVVDNFTDDFTEIITFQPPWLGMKYLIPSQGAGI